MISQFFYQTVFHEVDPSVRWDGDADIRLGLGFNDRIGSRFMRFQNSAPTRHIMERDVILDPVSGLVMRGDNALTWSCYFGPDDKRVAFQVADAISRKSNMLSIRGRRVYCGFNAFFRNYAHWITQCIPAIAGYALEPEFSSGLLLLPALPQGYLDALRFVGIDIPQICQIDGCTLLEIEDLTYSSQLQNFCAPSYHNRAVFTRMKSRAVVNNNDEKLYVWRIDTPNRPMVNETSLVRRLVEIGFTPIITSSMSIDEKINCFNGARIVVGPHGAGLANFVFCKPGAVVYELSPEHNIDLHTGFAMSLLAQTCSLHYWVDAFPSHGSFAEFGHQVPWSSDIEVIIARIREILLTYGIP